MKLATFFAGAIILAAAAGQAARAAEDTDETKIRGTWQLVSKRQKGVETKIEVKGEDASDEQPLTVTFEDQSWKAKLGPKGAPIEISGTYFLDATQTPKLLDLTIRGDKSSSDIPGIYKLESGKLHVRIREGGGQRPPDFDVSAEDCITLVFRQAK